MYRFKVPKEAEQQFGKLISECLLACVHSSNHRFTMVPVIVVSGEYVAVPINLDVSEWEVKIISSEQIKTV